MKEFFGSEVWMFVQGSMLWGVETEESDMDFNFLVDDRKVTQEDRDQLARYLAQKLPQDHKVKKGLQSPCIHIYLPQWEKMDITPRNATYYDFFTATLPRFLGTTDRLEADARLLEFFHLNPYARQGVQLLKKMFVNTTQKLPSYVMTHLYEQISRRFLTWDQFDGFTRVQSKEDMFEVLCETLREIGRFPVLDAASPLKRLLQDDEELPSPLRLKLSLERSVEVMGDVVKQGKDLNAKLESLVVSIMKDKRRFDEVFTTVPPSTRSPFASWMDATFGDLGDNPDIETMFQAANSYMPSPVKPPFAVLKTHCDAGSQRFFEEQGKGLHRMRRRWYDLKKGAHAFWLFHPWLLVSGEPDDFSEFLKDGLQLQLFSVLESASCMVFWKEMAVGMLGPASFEIDPHLCPHMVSAISSILDTHPDLKKLLSKTPGDVYWLESCGHSKMFKPIAGNEARLVQPGSNWWQTVDPSEPVVAPDHSKF